LEFLSVINVYLFEFWFREYRYLNIDMVSTVEPDLLIIKKWLLLKSILDKISSKYIGSVVSKNISSLPFGLRKLYIASAPSELPPIPIYILSQLKCQSY